MTLEDIQSLWNQDSVIDNTELTLEAMKVPQIHSKYYKIYIAEKMILRKYESEYKKLYLDKFEFYSQGPSPETPKDWKLPAVGVILKDRIPMYMDADEQIIAQSLKVALQKEKVDFVYSIISSINNRGYLLKLILDSEKFRSGI